jgi:RHS repeat-associated protein
MAQARGNRALVGTAQDLGNSLFTSTEYTNLNTTDTQFVTNLYEAFLQRAPDSSGLSHWVGQVPIVGRSNVRLAFAVCPEFADNVTALCPATSSGTSTAANLKYVLTDALGSTRALMNNTGSGTSTIIARHDYLPFGEGIWSGIGLRTPSQKYAVTDKVRQRFAVTERDEATGLDHTWFRKYDSYAGRWTTPDPVGSNLEDPQTSNRYIYTSNDPENMIDPRGLMPCIPGNISAECDSSGFGGWGWGDLGNRGMGVGRSIIMEREEMFDRSLRRYSKYYSRRLEGNPPPWRSAFTGSPFNGVDIKDIKEVTDCDRFAAEVARIALQYPGSNHSRLLEALRQRFNAEGEHNANKEFASSGFKTQFRDPDETSANQVRHYIGAFRASLMYGGIGRRYMMYRERARPGENETQMQSHQADIALNHVAFAHSKAIGSGRAKVTNLHLMILNDVCEKR